MKVYGIDTDGDSYLGVYNCIDFNKDLWIKLGKIMREKHRSAFQDHVKYLLPPYMKVNIYESENWDVCDK